MDWVRTVQLAQLLLKTIQASQASQSKAGEKTAMNDQTPTTDASVATPTPDAQPVATTTANTVPDATPATDATTADATATPATAPAPEMGGIGAIADQAHVPAQHSTVNSTGADTPATLQSLDSSMGHDTLAVMQSAIKLAQFLSENKDVMAFMNALMGIKPPDQPGVS